MEIIFQIDDPFLKDIDLDLITQALLNACQHFYQETTKAATGTITLVITDTETVQQLNYQYRDIDAPTDVLSFENRPDPEFPHMNVDHLGDIIIAYPVAKAQATTAGHTPMEEITLLAVHGLLHLLGFDHDAPAAKEKMWRMQGQIMLEMGLGHVHPTEN